MKIIGLAGQRKAGKTFLANLIKAKAEEYGIYAEVLSFAEPLKEEFCRQKGIGLETLYLNDLKEQFRQEMSDFSEECKKDNPYFFTGLLLGKLYSGGFFIIDDVRLLEIEAMTIKRLGAPVYRVYADPLIRKARGWSYNKDVDESKYELEMDFSADTFKVLFDGGWIFNNKNYPGPLIEEADILIRKHFLTFLHSL